MRHDPSVAIGLAGFTLIMMAMLGLTHMIYGNWPLGVLEISIGVLITAFVLRRFRDTY